MPISIRATSKPDAGRILHDERFSNNMLSKYINTESNKFNQTAITMKVEIWSDVMCPFCYIGKRRLEAALQQFNHPEDIDVEWKSFQLRPDMETQPEVSINQHLSKVKGWSEEEAAQFNKRMEDMAEEAGLDFNMDQAVVANSFDAHRFAHYAKTQGKGDEAEEALFNAYFTNGKNTDNHEVLVSLGEDIGLDPEETREVLESEQFADAVKEDIHESRKLGVQGVPFFVLDRKYAISGAQPTETFLEALQKSWSEWNEENQPVALNAETDGAVCGPDGNC
jgi:predicted DsbA family dithiol-disulfide isomerase